MRKFKMMLTLSVMTALLAGAASVQAAPELSSARASSAAIEAPSHSNLQIAWFDPPRPRPSRPACACVRG
jgi:hypothetical protein